MLNSLVCLTSSSRSGGVRSGCPAWFAPHKFDIPTIFFDAAQCSTSTVKAGFVGAVLDTGYHIELAGSGHYNTAALHSKITEIQKLIPTGVGITLNLLYINPRQFTFQFPLWQEMRKEGLPVEGFCVAAGIPTTEKAVEIIEGLKAAGIKHVAFKPRIFPAAIDRNLLKLVHLSNGFCMVDGAKPLAVGDFCKAEARIISVINVSEGKIIKAKGFVYHQGQCVIEVVSLFLYHRHFSDYENTFDTTEEPDYIVSLQLDTDVGILQSKEWFKWENESSLPLAGTSLIFRIQL